LEPTTLGKAPGYTYMLEMLARDKHTSLLLTFANYRCKKYYNILPWALFLPVTVAGKYLDDAMTEYLVNKPQLTEIPMAESSV
jgi:hypothetical protein